MDSITLQKLKEKGANLDEYFKYLLTLQKEVESKEDFVSDFRLFGNTERYLQLSIQCVLDITHLLVLAIGLERPHNNYEGLATLTSRHIISEKTGENLKKMVGLRNLLVHEYGKVDKEKIYHILKNDIEDIQLFKKEVFEYIESI
jgi:uncharacterized protein YutE (UPF0331/DUF86 family)